MPSSPRSPHLARFSEDNRLSVIAEDGVANVQTNSQSPQVNPRSTHRPFARRWKDAPPRASSELKPPDYTTVDESAQKKDRLADFRNKPAVARRGGWRRLLIIIIIALIVIVVALGVGLGVGLTRHSTNDASTASSSNSSSPSTANQTFPAGQYSINTYLDTVNTSCTANAATFRCSPYTTYSSNPSLSSADFTWIIRGSDNNYTISSSDNPFSIIFSNISLSLADSGSPNERYTFTTLMDKIVVPSSPITSDASQAECYFNSTVLSAALYTRMKAISNSASNTSSGGSTSWQVWPFAAEINQTIIGGNNVPVCYEENNGVIGNQVTSGLPAQPTDTQCGCFYRNFNL